MAYLFTPPTAHVRVNVDDFLFGRLLVARGVSLLKTDGTYRQVQYPTDEQIAAAEVVYLGGHTYLIDDAAYADLVEAGYGDLGEPAPVDPENPNQSFAYGDAPYGSGPYGGS